MAKKRYEQFKSAFSQLLLKNITPHINRYELARGTTYSRYIDTIKITKGEIVSYYVNGNNETSIGVEIKINNTIDNININDYLKNKNDLLLFETQINIIKSLKSININIVPEWNDLTITCSCGKFDYLLPCCHFVGVIFKYIYAMENNPQLLLKLHGIELDNHDAKDKALNISKLKHWKYQLIFDPIENNDWVLNFKMKIKVINLENTTLLDYIQAIQMNNDVSIVLNDILGNSFPEIIDSRSQDEFIISNEQLYNFLIGYLLQLELNSYKTKLIDFNLPKYLLERIKPKLKIMIDIKNDKKNNTFFSLKDILNWHWSIALNNDILEQDDFNKILENKSAIVKFRENYFHIDINELTNIIKKIKQKVNPNEYDILHSYYSNEIIMKEEEKNIIKNTFVNCNFSMPSLLCATLRPYQINGFNWILSNLLSGFGCILADDMGLGKTIQAISVILQLKNDDKLPNKSIIVVPAALIENWIIELNKFAPSIIVKRFHGQDRDLNVSCDVLLTTYQTVVRDEIELTKYIFSLLIVDEAHLLKNPQTQISKSIKNLKATYKLALSGTPVENRLEDMHSLFDFILPGYLGNLNEFKEQYSDPIENYQDIDIINKLKKVTHPFLLRRLKTDKTIISDLPEKIIKNEYSVLEKEQLALYQSIINSTLDKVNNSKKPSNRTFIVLSLLTKLKQICDHPRVYDKISPAKSELSGKTLLLLTLLDEIINNDEKVLIFSQYVETLNCLKQIIMDEMQLESLLYYGNMTQEERSVVLEKFKNEPNLKILLISLKAGGLGLNLTEASRVIHFDLWYNPAIENQATDRAFRIGQKRNVFVHRFIVKNTFEEKIDNMLSHKKELMEMTIADGESWITRMNDEEIKELFIYSYE